MKPKPLNTIPDIEECMATVMLTSNYQAILDEYHRLLSVMGNVDGDEIVAFVMVAILKAQGSPN